jgi:hypothetical protein
VAWLAGESKVQVVVQVLSRADQIHTSVLSLIESHRALARFMAQNLITPEQRQKSLELLERQSGQWTKSEITPTIQARAGEKFPVEPIRTLDAIHLASALELRRIYPELEVLSLDKRILTNARELGFRAGPG